MNTIKQQVNDTLNSLDNIQGAEANPLLYQKVMQRLNSSPARVISIKPSFIWSAAACLVLLFGINVLTCVNYNNTVYSVAKSPQTTATASALAKDYFSTSNIPQF